ncbi:hypothetical protein NQ318_008848 [Aromia moschata]|uniref:Uncharacterized protein n=1 Tax=Aromia moschata TaxID=1265417 RepID=A0AAV8ZCS6_9CUCU|nr:hypothetical protein NQ318_008848 [Aromia moschata]
MEANTQYTEKVNVWAGIINSQIMGPYFFDGTLTGARYLDFLQYFLKQTGVRRKTQFMFDLLLILIMCNVPLVILEKKTFQDFWNT